MNESIGVSADVFVGGVVSKKKRTRQKELVSFAYAHVSGNTE